MAQQGERHIALLEWQIAFSVRQAGFRLVAVFDAIRCMSGCSYSLISSHWLIRSDYPPVLAECRSKITKRSMSGLILRTGGSQLRIAGPMRA